MRPLLLLLPLAACVAPARPAMPSAADAGVRAEVSEKQFAKLLPLASPLPPPAPGNWIYEHPEPPQSFWQYVQSSPVRPTASRGVIYVLPLGDFTPAERAAVESAQLFLAAFFQLPVKPLPAIPASEIPASARRSHPGTGLPQLSTRWVLDRLLPPRRPADALVMLAFTPEDLYPDPAWNFVFGQASPAERVGVWSIHRLGDPAAEKRDFTVRTLRVAGHETGHMFGLAHCQAHACLMNGSNSLEESDSAPLELCPVCLRKLQWNLGFDLAIRFGALRDFERVAGLEPERLFIEQSLAALSQP